MIFLNYRHLVDQYLISPTLFEELYLPPFAEKMQTQTVWTKKAAGYTFLQKNC